MNIVKAEKSDKKAILRFYKAQHYSASFIGYDHCYFLRDKQTIIAAMIVSKIALQHHHYFLHALVVDKQYQQQGIATKLLQLALQKHQPLICFANESLSAFYTKSNMVKLTNSQMTKSLPEHLLLRFEVYRNKQPQLKVFKSVNDSDKTNS
ncbi:MAG: GNAT family N-acetyltransferase [Thalassotalea sp.]|nr:GNAT family N-acetyltransferase [Thalassotalea sp.]